MPELSPSTEARLKRVALHYKDLSVTSGAAKTYRRMLAHYYNLLIPPTASVIEIGCGSGELLELLQARKRTGVDLSPEQIERARKRLPEATFHVQAGEALELDEKFDCIVISETVNFAADVQALLARLHHISHPGTRLILNFYNTLWRPMVAVATWTRLRPRHPESNWLSLSDIRTLLDLADWDTVTVSPRIVFPFNCPGLETLFNSGLAPLLPHLCLTTFCTARPRRVRDAQALTTSVIIPARNEAGNIEMAVRRTPEMGPRTELIFVEGHSKDGTWEEIQRVARLFPQKNIVCLQQGGIGKGNAVREGFARATGDILMILDADLTTPPEDLPKFYEVIASGHTEFANGVRLIYPMETEAMRFLNLCANKMFSLMFTWLLGQPIKDTLCGTKALRRTNYERLAANRGYFGDFDPFGDFDLLFGAGKLNLKITDIAVRYAGRTYGSTNISRWKHGALLLRMALFAARKFKFV